MKPTKTFIATRSLKFCNTHNVYIMPAAPPTIFIKPAELKNLLRSCGADDVYYYV